ncbi:hypothetical protein, partial [Nocardioides sp.]|uniref:hypothetical protein n=1 Tax=Nocardioides sp. TaxID=35761 RepID=UPI0027350734
ALQRGVLSLKESSSIEGNVGVEAKLAAEAKVDRSGVIPALLATLEAGIKAGVWVDGQFDAEARVGPLALAELAKINAMAGVEAQFSSKAFANLRDGVGAEFEASGFAGAKVHGEATAEIALGPAALQIKGEVDAMAGAEGKVEGALSVSLTGVHAKFAAEAFAGAKASASGSASLKIRGKRIAYAKGTVEVYAGVGGKVKGEFEVKNGKIKFDFGAAAILGWGTGAEAEGEIDAGVLAGIVVAEISEMAASKDQKAVQSASPDYVREKLDDQAQAQKKEEAGYDALYDDFLAYANKKAVKGERGIKREKVQAIIDRITPHIRAELAYVETDQGIERAAMDAFRGQVKHINLQRGQIRAFQAVTPAEVTSFKERMQQEEKWRKARDGLAKDLDAYAQKKTTKGENGVKQQGVQQIISSHWKQLQSTFPGAEADEVVMFAAQAMKDQYLTKFTVKGGRIVEFEAPGVYAADAKKQAADTKAGAALNAALAQLDTGLATYRRTLLAKPTASFEQKQLEKVLRSSLSKVKAQLGDDAVNEQIAGRIRSGLAGIVDTVRLKNGAITVLGVKAGGLQAARAQQKTDEATKAQAVAAAEFGRRLAAYKEQKVGTGEHGMKADRAQKLLDEACAKVADWKTTPEAATELEAAAKEALGPFLKGIVVNGGRLAMFDVDRAKITAAKASRKADGKAVLDERDESGGGGQAE